MLVLAMLASSAPAFGDEQVYRLAALGYSAKEAADIVTGRISRQALDTARRMLAAGHGREAAADYLDRAYQRLAPTPPTTRREPDTPTTPIAAAAAPGVAALITHYAALHGIDATLVHAIAAVESAFNPAARSPDGAIGLMQLMPATARELGVNPLVTPQNIEGGVRYLAQQLRTFGGLELALVAYNAGPGFARRYAAGEAALYGETRRYVSRVLARLHPRLR